MSERGVRDVCSVPGAAHLRPEVTWNWVCAVAGRALAARSVAARLKGHGAYHQFQNKYSKEAAARVRKGLDRFPTIALQ